MEVLVEGRSIVPPHGCVHGRDDNQPRICACLIETFIANKTAGMNSTMSGPHPPPLLWAFFQGPHTRILELLDLPIDE